MDGKIAVIVLNYRHADMTIRCVDTLLSLGCGLLVSVVDNRSPDDSFRVLQERYAGQSDVLVTQTDKNGGYSYGNNAGIRAALRHFADIRFIAVINPDALVTDRRIFTEMVEDFARRADCAVVAPMMAEGGRVEEERSGWFLPSKKDLLFAKKGGKSAVSLAGTPYREVEVIHGSFFIVKRDDFERAGFFDVAVFLYGEETILGVKMRRAGKKEVLDTRFSYVHDHDYGSESKWQRLRKFKGIYRSTRYILKEYYGANVAERAVYCLTRGALYYVLYPIRFTASTILNPILKKIRSNRK